MKEYDYDLFVIGAGSGGVRAARMSAGFGARTGIAEERYLGGTCVNVGCVPKKLFVYASHFADEFHDAAGFGWQAGDTRFDWQALVANKDREIGRLNGIYGKLLQDAGVTLYEQRATVVDEHTVSLDGKSISAEKILVATGGWPVIPDIPGREHVISSNEAFFLRQLPERVVIVGGGYIAVEFAGIFNGLGMDTTLVYRGDLFLRGFDHEIRAFLKDEMQKKGITLLFNSTIEKVDRHNDELHARLTTGDTLAADLVMYATGRKPNTSGLGLENVPVKLDDKGAIMVDERYCSSSESIYAIGDVTNRVNLTPVATAEGTVLANNLFNNGQKVLDYSDIPSCVFSQPNLGSVGLTEEKAREQFDEVDIYRSTFTHLKHTLSGSSERTFMKIIVDRKTDRVAGVHMVGADAGEIIQGIAIAMKAGATKSVFDATIGIHPTAAEEFVTMRQAS